MTELDRALRALDEPVFCEGTLQLTERISVMLPNGDLSAIDDPDFVAWLIANGEIAPFGTGMQTKLDPAVRLATRLTARGDVRIGGFDPDLVLDEIETTLSPRTHLVATLTDVLTYDVGGHFANHKDTPTSPELIGTLVVGLPIEHTGGAFAIDGEVIDWSGPVEPNTVRWVAMFSDTDHAVQTVTAGHRVTLVYALALSEWERVDRGRTERLAALRAAASQLAIPDGERRLIACARQVIALDGPQPQPIATLRGADRDIADVLVEAGFKVVVRTCLAARDVDYERPANELFRADDGPMYYATLKEPLPERDIAEFLECVVFEEGAWGDGGGYDDGEATPLGRYIARRPEASEWIFREQSAAMFVRTIEFADDGFIGNGAYTAYLYKLAALEVSR